MLVIQVIEILWTKASRGAPLSNLRSHLPRAFPIDLAALDDDDARCLIQQHRIVEWEGFRPVLHQREQLAAPPGSVEALRITALKGGVYGLGLLGTPKSGRPLRHPVPEAFELLPGEFACLSLNARHTSTRGQHYRETIYNVASGDPPPADRFLRGPPEHRLDLKANLF
ncbi:hypothetical protein [Roseateles violae]|uniref:Uncharacterized protein n=1 Tax=Roseateles violae TaxID=3058042 RepID=A0ABT8DV61_9BURK|nr:hypothetical protein [Pelomonas sp. PFR6]MDN3920794.1 hypothetical protein [Pelomonas sp. PFR6]